jgi:hypothetical protein
LRLWWWSIPTRRSPTRVALFRHIFCRTIYLASEQWDSEYYKSRHTNHFFRTHSFSANERWSATTQNWGCSYKTPKLSPVTNGLSSEWISQSFSYCLIHTLLTYSVSFQHRAHVVADRQKQYITNWPIVSIDTIRQYNSIDNYQGKTLQSAVQCDNISVCLAHAKVDYLL